MRPELRGTLAVLASAACYSTLAICVKLALGDGARILPLVAWRFVIGTALLWILLGLAGRRLPPRASVPALLGLGVLYAGDALAALSGLVWVPAATASLLFYTGGMALGGASRSVAMALLLGTVGTAIPIPLFLAGVKLIGPGKAAIYSTVEPALTVSMAALILGEPLTGAQLAGGGLILAAVVWLRAERPLPESEEPPAVETL